MSRLRFDKPVVLVALFGVVIAQSPRLFDSTTSARLVALAPFLVGIFFMSAFFARPTFRPRRWPLAALWVYLGFLVITLLRGVGVSPTINTTRSAALECAQFLVVAWFAYRLVASARTDEDRWTRLIALALSPAVFVAFNLLIMKVKLPLITVPEQAKGAANGTAASYLGALGIGATRSNLPLASGVNGSGAISAAGFAAAALIALYARRPPRAVTIIAALLCVYSTLMSDSHTALWIGLGVVALFALYPHVRKLSWVSLVAAASPLLLVAGSGIISSVAAGLVAHEGGGSVGTLDDRTFIWSAAWRTISRTDAYHLLVGFGGYGQVTSGASRGYGELFEGATLEPLQNTVHDLTLQTLLDGGIIGLVVLVLWAWATLSALGRAPEKTPCAPIQALTAVFLVFILNGATEALPTYQFPESLAAVLLVSGAAAALAPRKLAEPAEARVARHQAKARSTRRRVTAVPSGAPSQRS